MGDSAPPNHKAAYEACDSAHPDQNGTEDQTKDGTRAQAQD